MATDAARTDPDASLWVPLFTRMCGDCCTGCVTCFSDALWQCIAGCMRTCPGCCRRDGWCLCFPWACCYPQRAKLIKGGLEPADLDWSQRRARIRKAVKVRSEFEKELLEADTPAKRAAFRRHKALQAAADAQPVGGCSWCCSCCSCCLPTPHEARDELVGAVRFRTEWKNFSGNQSVVPVNLFHPSTLGQLIEIVARASAVSPAFAVRALGSGHSYSPVAITDGFLINTHGMNHILDFNDTFKPGVGADTLVSLEAGMRISDAIDVMEDRGLAFKNLGSYTGQTLAGAISTGTHGSGLRYWDEDNKKLERNPGPIADQLTSVLLVVNDRAVLVEPDPEMAVTDKARFQDKYHIKVIQNTTTFNAVKISMGSFGVWYAVTVRARRSFFLKETRRVRKFEQMFPATSDAEVVDQVRAELGLPTAAADRSGDEDARRAAIERVRDEAGRELFDFNMSINPYETTDEAGHMGHTIVASYRYEVGADDPMLRAAPSAKRPRGLAAAAADKIPYLSDIMTAASQKTPDTLPEFIDTICKFLEDEDYVGRWSTVLSNTSSGFDFLDRMESKMRGYACEVAFPLSDMKKALDTLFAVAGRMRKYGKLYLTSPVGLRFVNHSETFLAPMHADVQAGDADEPFFMVEVLAAQNTVGGYQLMTEWMEAAYNVGGRPHWGLNMEDLAGRGILRQLRIKKTPHFVPAEAAAGGAGGAAGGDVPPEATAVLADSGRRSYRYLDTWLGVYNRFNPPIDEWGTRLFANSFTVGSGIDELAAQQLARTESEREELPPEGDLDSIEVFMPSSMKTSRKRRTPQHCSVCGHRNGSSSCRKDAHAKHGCAQCGTTEGCREGASKTIPCSCDFHTLLHEQHLLHHQSHIAMPRMKRPAERRPKVRLPNIDALESSAVRDRPWADPADPAFNHDEELDRMALDSLNIEQLADLISSEENYIVDEGEAWEGSDDSSDERHASGAAKDAPPAPTAGGAGEGKGDA